MSTNPLVSQKALALLEQYAEQGLPSSDIPKLFNCSSEPKEIEQVYRSFRTSVFTLRSHQKRIDYVDGKYYYKGPGTYSIYRRGPGATERKLSGIKGKRGKGKREKEIPEIMPPIIPVQNSPSSGAFIFAINRKAYDKLTKILCPIAQEELTNIAARVDYYNKLSNNLAELRPFLKNVNIELLVSGK